MTPVQSKEFWQSIISITLFASNIFFWLQSGYFEGSSELKPFLHTWSLAVEEQYYVVFPVVLALMARWAPRMIIPLLALTAVASLALSEFMSFHQESANFYLTPTRSWELLAGALCAFHLRSRGRTAATPPTILDQMLAGAGLALVGYAILAFNDWMRFPGLSTLVPVGGAALIILYARTGTFVARLLSLRPMVGVGLVSYSTYLWHQPLFAFARLQSMTEPSKTSMMALAVASLVLGALSWRFVERPFRVPQNSFANSRARVFLASGAMAAALLGVGTFFVYVAPPTYMAMAHPGLMRESRMRAYEPQGAYLPCPGFTDNPRALCRRLGKGPKRVVIWGDSHANALSSGAHAIPGYSIFILGHGGCPPMIGIARTDFFGNADSCNVLGKTDAYAQYVYSLKAEKVFLVSRWTLYAEGMHVHSRLQRNTYFLTDKRDYRDGASSSVDAMMAGIGRTVDALRQHGAQVYLIQQVPDLHDYSPRAIVLLKEVPEAPITAWHANESAILAEGGRHGATVIATHDLFCAAGQCQIRVGDQPQYIDDSHLNYYGAAKLFKRVTEYLD